MELTQFFEQIEQHPALQGVAIEPERQDCGAGVIVKFNRNDLMTRLPVAAIEAAEWPVLEEVLTGKREPQVLQHMTRVVGYFSRVENWNKSKVGELKDRQKGNYSVAG